MAYEGYIALAMPRRELGGRAEARTKEIERCLALGAEWALMIDTDEAIPWNALLEILLNHPQHDIVVVDAPNKGLDDSNIYLNPDGTLDYFTISCCLLNLKIFDILPYPWFRSDLTFIKKPAKDGKYQYEIEPKSFDDNIGEDVFFSKEAIKAGLDIYILPNMKARHV